MNTTDYHIDSSLLTTSYWNVAANATSAKYGIAALTSAFIVALQLNPRGDARIASRIGYDSMWESRFPPALHLLSAPE